jgi:hypothetical protein
MADKSKFHFCIIVENKFKKLFIVQSEDICNSTLVIEIQCVSYLNFLF